MLRRRPSMRDYPEQSAVERVELIQLPDGYVIPPGGVYVFDTANDGVPPERDPEFDLHDPKWWDESIAAFASLEAANCELDSDNPQMIEIRNKVASDIAALISHDA